ncbi:MAG TPA: nucleotidyltransferase, partial [Dehalococcoidia bacterium]
DGLFAAGVRETTIIIGYQGEKIVEALGNVSPCGMKLRFVENDRFELGNARSLWAARDAVRSDFVLAMGDHVSEPELTRAVVAGADRRHRLAVDRADGDDARADEATRVRVRDGRVVDLGKSLPDWNALDTGTFWCTPQIFDALDDQRRDGELGDLFGMLARAGDLDAVDVSGRRWIDIDTAADLARAEAMLGADGRLA